jgi:GTP cyclohydrolase IA
MAYDPDFDLSRGIFAQAVAMYNNGLTQESKDQMIIDGARLILQGLGVDITDHNFSTTPERVLKVYKELFAPPETDMPSFNEDYTDIVVMRGAEFYTMCPHHMLPVRLEASIAYLPKGKVIGASKLIRMCYDANRQPMTQEKLTDEISQKIAHYTGESSRGSAVLLRGHHGCFSIRGVRQHAASMVTAKFTGEFHDRELMQDRFYHLVNGGK